MKEKYNIVIIGGGISGSSCAYIASKLGLKVLLIEKRNYLGGLMTGGLVTPMMLTDTKNLNVDFYSDLIKACKKLNTNINYNNQNPGWFNPELLKITLEQLLNSVGVNILYDTSVKNCIYKNKNYITYISNFYTERNKNKKILSIPIESEYIVDATGNGAISKMLGAEFLKSTNKNKTQASTLRFILSNVDSEKFVDMLSGLNESEDKTSYELIDDELHFTTAYTWDTNTEWKLEPYFKKALEDGVLIDTDLEYFQIFSIARMPNSVSFNCPRLRDTNNNIYSHSKALVEARQAIIRLWNFMKTYIPGFENSYISNIADITGIREEGRVLCDYTFTSSDIISETKFGDKILYSNYPIDIHSNKKNKSVLSTRKLYEFPLKSLQVKGFKNLYVVGKCAGADFESQASLRIQMTCMSMGEAIAKAIKVKYDCLKSIKDLKISQ